MLGVIQMTQLTLYRLRSCWTSKHKITLSVGNKKTPAKKTDVQIQGECINYHIGSKVKCSLAYIREKQDISATCKTQSLLQLACVTD